MGVASPHTMMPATTARTRGEAKLRPVFFSLTLCGMTATVCDEELMLRYRDGDAAAFEELYGRHRGGVFRYLLRGVKSHALAEELYQDVWLSLVRARAGYAVSAKFTTYLYRIAHNKLIDHYRGNNQDIEIGIDEQAGVTLEELAQDHASGPEQTVIAKQQAARVVDVLEALPLAQREAYLMFEESGMSIEEIAQATGVNRETAKSRLRYAFDKLRRALQD
jgi:RNA polymerase sigma-70 factor, ECF subfamily